MTAVAEPAAPAAGGPEPTGGVAPGGGAARGPAEEPVLYARGTSVAFERAQALRVATGAWLAVLVVLLGVLVVSALGDTSRSALLAQRGRAVTATVANCIAVASGTGETTYLASCRATYTLGGQTHSALIHGMSRTVPAGTRVAAVVDPAHPATLSTRASLAGGGASVGAFVPAAATAGVLVASVALIGWRRRSTRAAASGAGRRPAGEG